MNQSWLYRGLTSCTDEGSEASSQDAYTTLSPACLLQLPSKQVVSQLGTSSHGEQLLHIVRQLASQLLAQSVLCPTAAAARGLLDGLQELHSCIVALDDMIDEQRISSGVATQLDECRQWLRHTQGFVLQLLKQVQGFAGDRHAAAAAASTDAAASMDEDGSSTPLSVGVWRAMCQEASDALANVVETMAAPGAAQDGPATQPPTGQHTRLVAQSSRLSYATHWSKKVAI